MITYQLKHIKLGSWIVFFGSLQLLACIIASGVTFLISDFKWSDACTIWIVLGAVASYPLAWIEGVTINLMLKIISGPAFVLEEPLSTHERLLRERASKQ